MGYRINSINKTLLVTLILVVLSVPYVFFMIYHQKYYVENGLVILVILCSVLDLLNSVLFILTSISDAGHVQKLSHPSNTYDYLLDKYRTTNPLRLIDVTINGQLIKVKYCITCHIYRPPRTVHCSDCDVCVLRYDHHCPYVSNCVGYYNYKTFIMFVLTCSLYFGVLLSVFIHRIVIYSSRFQYHVDVAPVDVIGTLVNAIIIFIFLWLIFGLYCFHVCIICKNYSTYDKMKDNYVTFNPFNRGCFLNCKSILCYSPQRQKKKMSFNVYQPYASFSLNLVGSQLRLGYKREENAVTDLNTITCVYT